MEKNSGIEILQEVSIELTDQCGCACLHCSSDSGRIRKKSLSLSKVLSILDEARALGTECISLSGGDPMVWGIETNRMLLENIAGRGMYWLWYSSGVGLGETLDENWADMFARYHMPKSRVILSLEAYYPEHDYLITRATGRWHTVVHATEILRERGVKFEIHVTPLKMNFLELRRLTTFALDVLGAEKVSFLRFVPQGRGLRNKDKLLLTADEFDTLQLVLLQLEQMYPQKVRLGCPIDFRHVYTSTARRFCHAGQDLLLIRPDGNIHCCAGWKNNGGLVLGNVYENTLEEAWHSDTAKLLRWWNEEGYKDSDCGGCEYLEMCHGGCPAQRIIRNLDAGFSNPEDLLLRGADPLCPHYNRWG